MRYQHTLRLLGSIACCAVLGCQPSQPVSSTTHNSDREATRSTDSDEAGTPAPVGDRGSAQAADAGGQGERPSGPATILTVSDQKRSNKPSQLTNTAGTGKRGPAADFPPSIETELPSESTPAAAADSEGQTEVRETFYGDGSTRRQWIVKILPDGTEVEHGEALLWHQNGQVWLQGEYVDGVRQGLWLSWHPNGNKRGEGRLHLNRRIGTWIRWDEKGQKRSEAAYELGLAHGKSTVWDEDGNVIETGEYVRRKKHGTWIKYVDGEKTETEWVNGVLVE